VIVACALIFGLAFGSFVNAAVDRIPRGQSLHGRSRCDACGRQLRLLELIPVVSYVALRGQCSGCKSRIGFRNPCVEALCAFGYAAAFLSLPLPAAFAVCVAATAAIIAAGAIFEKRGLTR
jgi:leader peptidase (prepilin peptidase) / N-methyltransferase